MSYQVGFCFWLLTFEQEIAEQINKKFDIIPLLTTVAQTAVKEKVIRVIVATFRVEHSPHAQATASAHILPEPHYQGTSREPSGHACRSTASVREESVHAEMVG